MIIKLDRYLLRSNLGLLAGLIGLALSILLLERMIRITEIITGSDDAAVAAAKIILNLVPHYLEMALPGALLIAVIISVDRLSRSGEIVAMMSTGISLHRIVRPYMGLAVVLALASVLISGFLQPVTRYNYREIVHDLKQSSIVSAFRESKFVQFKDRVVWTGKVDFSGRNLGETFIIETADDGSRQFMTGRSGTLRVNDEGIWEIGLQDVMVGRIPAEIVVDAQGDRVRTANVTWQLPKTTGTYRERGYDQRELTLTELLSRSYLDDGSTVDPVAAAADLHNRLSRSALLTVLPLLGVVLGLNLGRVARSGGLAIGIVLLLMIQKLLEYGLLLSQRGTLPPWAGLWPIVIVVALGSGIAFQRTANGRPAVPRSLHRRRKKRPPAESKAEPAKAGTPT